MSTKTSVADVSESTDGYATFEHLIRDRVASAPKHLFCTSADPDKLWAAYLESLPTSNRQHYNCNCCRRFVQRFGGLVAIADDGEQTPVVWSPDMIPHVPFFAKAVEKLHDLVKRAKVEGVFLTTEKTWGTPQNTAGPGSKYVGQTFEHISGTFNHPFKAHPLQNADRAMAEKVQDHGILQHALSDYSEDVVKEAKHILNAGALCREEKALARVEWFLKLIRAVNDAPKKYRSNVVWKFVAEAPPGFCHVRSNVENTLFDDIKEGTALHEVQRKWEKKLHPLQYLRPQTAPSPGQIDRAEKIFAQLNLAPALERRFAKLEEVRVRLWEPRAAKEQKATGGTFGHLRKKSDRVEPVELPNRPVTVVKFMRDVLPKALSVQALIVGHVQQSFYGLLTAVHADAPPIIQWDAFEHGGTRTPRNPVSWYFYSEGNFASNWGLAGRLWVPVTAVFLPPHEWDVPGVFSKSYGNKLFFALDGCVDQRWPSLCLFPEILKGELREVRSVMEAHSNAKRGEVQGRLEGTANGIAWSDARSKQITLRVETEDGFEQWTLDRWE